MRQYLNLTVKRRTGGRNEKPAKRGPLIETLKYLESDNIELIVFNRYVGEKKWY